jgi:hypothetical protein
LSKNGGDDNNQNTQAHNPFNEITVETVEDSMVEDSYPMFSPTIVSGPGTGQILQENIGDNARNAIGGGPFPSYRAIRAPGTPPPAFDHESPNPIMLPIEFPPSIYNFPDIIEYIARTFIDYLPVANREEYIQLWTHDELLGLKTTWDFIHWLTKEPPYFYESYYPGKWIYFRDVVIQTRIIVDFCAEWSRIQDHENRNHTGRIISLNWETFLHYSDAAYARVSELYPILNDYESNGLAGFYTTLGVAPVEPLTHYLDQAHFRPSPVTTIPSAVPPPPEPSTAIAPEGPAMFRGNPIRMTPDMTRPIPV